jgi:hypothetical protein
VKQLKENCVVSETFTISTTPQLDSAVFANNCIFGGDGSAEVSIYDGTPPFTYTWSNNVSSAQTGNTVTLSNGGGSFTMPNTSVTAGTNVTVTGSGSSVSPYVVSAADTSLYANNGTINTRCNTYICKFIAIVAKQFIATFFVPYISDIVF